MRIHRIVVVLFTTLAALLPPVEAQGCAGFTDVPGTSIDPTCANVTWMKNRSVTLGCTATTYCPGNGVGRLQMAAFMNRVGNLMSPKVFSTEANGGTLDLSTEHVLCQTADLPALARDYPRTIDSDASLSFEVDGFQRFIVTPVLSKNGGSWQAMGQGSYPAVTPGVRHHVGALTPGFVLFDGNNFPPPTLKFGLHVTRTQSAGGMAITSWSCHLQVMIRNATYALEF